MSYPPKKDEGSPVDPFDPNEIPPLVRATKLLSLAIANTKITADDTVLTAFGKLQGQIDELATNGGGGEGGGEEPLFTAFQLTRGQAGGYPPLGADNKIPNIHLPGNGSYKFSTRSMTTVGERYGHNIGGVEFGYEYTAANGGRVYMKAQDAGPAGERNVTYGHTIHAVEPGYRSRALHVLTDAIEYIHDMSANGSQRTETVLDIDGETWVIQIIVFGTGTHKVHIQSERVS